MLPRKADWKQELREAFTQPEALLGSLGLDPRLAAPAAARQFPFLVPRGFARLMVPGDPDDPLLRQVLPLAAELEEHPGYSADPVGDAPSRRATGLLRKYQGRALLLVTGACALHCRYCFRRHFPYARDTLVQDRDQAALALLARDPGITEVVLSGGDPLMLDDEGLAALFNRLTAIPHLRRLRLHTRLPVVLPARITPSLLALLAASRLPIALVIHANHAREVRGEEVHAALSALKATGATLLNQSVLLRGVNAEAASLADLSEALFAAGVLPYYLHRLDPVAGAAHFAVSLAEARAIMAKLRTELPGYLVPKLVRELPGGAYKEPCG
ncbi:MAG: EF-P beta-lysylation protein EpmB [Chromatiaceae bacterium]|nr:EF-P beta-lysylation protein EpmB [Chromatiaceae bacterium]